MPPPRVLYQGQKVGTEAIWVCLPYHQVAVHCSHHRGEGGDMRGKEVGTGGRGEGEEGRGQKRFYLNSVTTFYVCVLSQ